MSLLAHCAARCEAYSRPLSFFGVLLLWVFLILAVAGQSEGKIRGIFYSNSDGRTLPNTNVILAAETDSSFRTAATEVDGCYGIERIPAGRYYLRVSYVGFRTYRDTIDTGAESARENVELLSRSDELRELTVEADEVAPG